MAFAIPLACAGVTEVEQGESYVATYVYATNSSVRLELYDSSWALLANVSMVEGPASVYTYPLKFNQTGYYWLVYIPEGANTTREAVKVVSAVYPGLHTWFVMIGLSALFTVLSHAATPAHIVLMFTGLGMVGWFACAMMASVVLLQYAWAGAIAWWFWALGVIHLVFLIARSFTVWRLKRVKEV